MSVDKNEIPPTEDLITPERLAKGDLEVATNTKGKISRAIPSNLTIVKELIRRGVFPYHYEIYGVGFLELRAAFRAPWRIRNSVALLEKEALEQLGIVVSNTRADEIYQRVWRRLGTRKINIIQYVLEEMKEKEKREDHGTYKESFEYLVFYMDEEREKIFMELNNR